MKRFLLVLSALAVSSVVASATFGDPPPITIDVSTAVTTTDPAGTDVTYSVASQLNPPVDVTCSPEGGPAPQFTVTRHFDVGDTTISCTDGTNNAEVTVTVTYSAPPPPPDTTPPVLTVPGDIPPVEATSGSGAVVTFSATATDDTDPSPQVNCSPGSGSTFPLGETTVSCTATDSSGNTSPASTFKVTVRDTTRPALGLPSNISVEADSSAGKVVTYSATAGDAVSGSLSPTCSPASGSTFPIGTTTVNCTVSDGAGNSQAGNFSVTVTDTSGPALSSVPSTVTAEANGPGGAVVSYTTPTAVDAVDGPQPVSCSRASHTLFPLGTTTVQCTAADDHGNTSSASFQVAVVDTTPPTLAVPGPTTVYATTPAGIPETAPAFIAFRKAATADDIVDSHPTISDNLGSFAQIGTHDVGFVARDASGNVTAKATQLIVLPMPPAGTPVLPAPAPAKLPPDVAKLQTFPGDGFVRLVWGAVPGAARYLVYRSETGARRLAAAGHGDLVYSGTATTFTDRGLKNGVEYRYVVVSEDPAGNQSAGVGTSAVPNLNLLRSPKDGARLRQPPKLVWTPNAEAAYYNVQLYRGQAKILSTWPVRANVKLKRNWKYAGRRYTLTRGAYRWYVWPGFGARAKVDYGELLGSKSFVMAR
jgi:HYR domain-containing protein